MRKKKKGLTLVEVIVSLAILSIIITPVLSMVLSSVKTSKSGEDKQKALYLAQQYIEEEKSANSVNVSMPEVIGNFRIKKTITPLPEYKFPDVESGGGTSTSLGGTSTSTGNKFFNDIVYDYKIVVNSSEGNSSKISLEDKSGNKYISEMLIGKSVDIQVTGGKEFEDIVTGNPTVDENKLIIKINSEGRELDKIVSYTDSSGRQLKGGYIVVQFTGEGKLPSVNIKASNYCADELIFYFAKKVGLDVDYSVINQGGKIKSYSNILVNSDESGNSITYTNNSRVYKIIIRVWKKNQDESDKPIQEITAYKSVAQ